jgi:hypothetical protein
MRLAYGSPPSPVDTTRKGATRKFVVFLVMCREVGGKKKRCHNY